MKLILNDGGRKEAGFKGSAGDCACRAVAIATDRPYREVYDDLNEFAKTEKSSKRRRGKSSARNGYHSHTLRKYMKSIGWTWIPTMGIGTGCKVHLADGELPDGTLIVRLSRHYTVVIDGVIHDTHDPQRATIHMENGIKRISRRCVYGYWARQEVVK